MHKYQKVAELVEKAYVACDEDFGTWMWKNHVPVVAQKAEQLSIKYGADLDLSVAGAYLHDFGDAFMYRFAENHEEVSETKAREVLVTSGYSEDEIHTILEKIIAPHSCKDGFLPETIEGKVLATADALAHLTTDFYLQFAWMHLPENKSYDQFIVWVKEKLERDYKSKIFFEEIKEEVRYRYDALTKVFTTE